MGIFSRIINEEGRETKANDKRDFIRGDIQQFPTLEEFEAAEEDVFKPEMTSSSTVDNFRSNKARGSTRPFRERKADAKADAIFAEREKRDAPVTSVPSDSIMKDTKASETTAKVNFAQLERSQRKARKSEPSPIGNNPNDGRDLEQDRNKLAETVHTEFDEWKDEKDESDLLGWDTPRDRIF